MSDSDTDIVMFYRGEVVTANEAGHRAFAYLAAENERLQAKVWELRRQSVFGNGPLPKPSLLRSILTFGRR